MFLCDNLKILNFFNGLTLKQLFCKTKTFFKKLEYCFSFESTKFENASFPCKTGISEGNVNTNKMVTTKWTYRKERSFASNYFIIIIIIIFFLEILFQQSWFVVPTTKMTIFVLFVSAGVSFDGAFSSWVSLIASVYFSICFIYLNILLVVGVSYQRVPCLAKAIPKLRRPILSGRMFVSLEVTEEITRAKNPCQ